MSWSILNNKSTATWEDVKSQFVNYFMDPNKWVATGIIAVKIVMILVIGNILLRVLHKFLEQIFLERERNPLKIDQRRTRTIGKLVQNVSSYIVNFVMLLLVLSQVGFNLAPVLAGAGVLGLAIGFGAQSLVKDVITGFFIIFEDQFGVGDVVQIGSNKGTVEEIGLRITRLRSWTGEVHIIPNGSIAQVTNFSIHNSLAVIDVALTKEQDVEKAMAVLKETLEEYAHHENLIKQPEVLGVQTLSASEVIIRVTAECKPNTNVAVTRQLNLAIKKALMDEGITQKEKAEE